MLNFLHHLFIPRKSNNHRPKVLHHDFLFLLVVVLLVSLVSFTFIKKEKPAVLGTLTDVSSEELLMLTNVEREKNGQKPLRLNNELTIAAQYKAKNMFEKKYWAHFAPDGTSPWQFIKEADYQYVYAGENLARGFSTTEEVVHAWMESPSHRENMLSFHYEDVGFAVVKGDLVGENTVLVVEMFGGKNANPDQEIADANIGEEGAGFSSIGDLVRSATAVQNKPMIDSIKSVYIIALFVLGLLIVTFVVDLFIVQRKKIIRLVGHNIDHIVFLSAIFVFIILYINGVVL